MSRLFTTGVRYYAVIVARSARRAVNECLRARSRLTMERVRCKISISHAKGQHLILRKVLVSCSVLGVISTFVCSVDAGKPLRGVAGVELGMSANAVAQVLMTGGNGEYLLKTADGLSWRVPNHRVFRHADFRFDSAGNLTEIVLSIRECLDKKKAVQEIRKTHEVDLAGETTVVSDCLVLKMVGNKVFIKNSQTSVVGTGRGQQLSGQQQR